MFPKQYGGGYRYTYFSNLVARMRVPQGYVLSRLSPYPGASLAKKKMKEHPLQPMDFFSEMTVTPVNSVDSEIDN